MERYESLYRQLFRDICAYAEMDGGNMPLATHFPVVGKYYRLPKQSCPQKAQRIRFMIVGRCSNGWESQPHVAFQYTNEDLYVREAKGYIATRATAAQWREEAGQQKGIGDKPYNINRSAFWRTAKRIWAKLSEKESDIPNDWYEYVIWTNLFPVAPEKGGNASNGLCDAQTETAIKLFKETIRYFQPTHVLVESGMKWFSFTYKGQHHTFHDCIDLSLSNKSVAGRCVLLETRSRIVIANRPERIDNKVYREEAVRAFETMTVSDEDI